MDLTFITDPELAPRPRHEIRIRSLQAEAYPDGQRVKVTVSIVPFGPADRPSLEIAAINPAGLRLGSTTVIEATQPTLALTLHLRQQVPAQGEEITLCCALYYEADRIQDSACQPVVWPAT